MKCPACGFETPDGQAWCDFCKHPFRAKPEKDPPSEKKPALLSPDVLLKLDQVKSETSGQVKEGIPPEFAHLDSGEKIPEVPPIARYLAWGILAVVVLWAIVGMVWISRHAGAIGSNMAQGELGSK